MIIAMPTLFLCGPSHWPMDESPLLDAAVARDCSLVGSVAHKLLLIVTTYPSMTQSIEKFISHTMMIVSV